MGGLAIADGGYFPQSWGWASLGLAWAAAAGLLLRRRLEAGWGALAMLALLAAFTAWALLSSVWSDSVPLSALEAERGLLYVLALGAFVVLGSSRGLTAGVVLAAAVIAIWNLAAGDAEPVGYTNGLALLAALAIVLAFRHPPLLVAVPLLLVVVVRTDSRGAWLALAVGFAGALAARRGRRAPVAVVLAGLALALALGATDWSPRDAYWSVALGAARDAPVLGEGAGTFERTWLRERPTGQAARDAHNLYLETLAELGPLGLALLLGALAVPLAWRARSPAATGAYVAFLVHAALDWDWEQAVLVVSALAAAAASLPGTGVRLPRAPALAATAALAALAAFALAGNALLGRSAAAAQESDWDVSARWARRAADAAPWAAEPWERLALAQEAQGDDAAARESLREALERDPGDPELWIALARVSAGAERRAALERAARLNPLGTVR
ncbi:MAG: O-antigen ligase family protein [Gaiellaceae bacterium]